MDHFMNLVIPVPLVRDRFFKKGDADSKQALAVVTKPKQQNRNIGITRTSTLADIKTKK